MARLVTAASDAGKDTTRRLPKTQILNGVLLKDVAVTSSSTTISHMLSRTPQGWIVVDKDANEDVWRVSWNTRQIVLDATGNVTVALWVF